MCLCVYIQVYVRPMYVHLCVRYTYICVDVCINTQTSVYLCAQYLLIWICLWVLAFLRVYRIIITCIYKASYSKEFKH